MIDPTRRSGIAAAGAVALALVLVLAGCGGGSGGEGQQAAPPDKTLTVSAAASLNKVYPRIAEQFEAANPGADVRFNFGGSDQLAQQVVAGAPADVLATASTTTMQTAQQAGKIDGPPVSYATNTLQIAVAPNDPKGIRSLQDLARPDVTSVVCLPTVPCGAAATAAEQAAGVALRPDSQEQDVTGVLNRVRTGNADAGLVYITDVKGANGAVQGIDLPQQGAKGVKQTYPIAVVAGTQNADLARSWVAFVTGPQGKAALSQAGFVVTP